MSVIAQIEYGTCPRTDTAPTSLSSGDQLFCEAFFCLAQRSLWASAIFFLASTLRRRRFFLPCGDAGFGKDVVVLEPASSCRTVLSLEISSSIEAMILFTSMALSLPAIDIDGQDGWRKYRQPASLQL